MSGVQATDYSGALLELKDVHKSFGHVDVINGVSLPVRKGEHVVIFGPSGGGKSTPVSYTHLTLPTNREV